MNNQDKIFEKIRNHAFEQEGLDFDSKDKIWDRIATNLDQKNQQSNAEQWKKIAIAASILLFVSLGYIFMNNQNETNNATVNHTKNQELIPNTNPKVIAEKPAEIIEKPSVINEIKPEDIVKTDAIVAVTKDEMRSSSKTEELMKLSNKLHLPTAFETRLASKSRSDVTATDSLIKPKAVELQANPPLLVIDGSVVKTSKKATKEDILNDIANDEAQEVLVLDEPLYIINGEEFTEESLFGKNPTSKYAPLSKQKILSLELMEEEEAFAKYGDKAKKGVVIIKTKNGIPNTK
jgi:hypothetical protein